MGQQLWAGVDAGKSEHHCVVIDGEGQRLLSRRVANDETVLLELIDAVSALAGGGEITWAIDLNHGGAALLITLLVTAEQRLLYIPGRTVYHASGSYRGDGKTDAKDAAIIADQARMRRDLQPRREAGQDRARRSRLPSPAALSRQRHPSKAMTDPRSTPRGPGQPQPGSFTSSRSYYVHSPTAGEELKPVDNSAPAARELRARPQTAPEGRADVIKQINAGGAMGSDIGNKRCRHPDTQRRRRACVDRKV